MKSSTWPPPAAAIQPAVRRHRLRPRPPNRPRPGRPAANGQRGPRRSPRQRGRRPLRPRDHPPSPPRSRELGHPRRRVPDHRQRRPSRPLEQPPRPVRAHRRRFNRSTPATPTVRSSPPSATPKPAGSTSRPPSPAWSKAGPSTTPTTSHPSCTAGSAAGHKARRPIRGHADEPHRRTRPPRPGSHRSDMARALQERDQVDGTARLDPRRTGRYHRRRWLRKLGATPADPACRARWLREHPPSPPTANDGTSATTTDRSDPTPLLSSSSAIAGAPKPPSTEPGRSPARPFPVPDR